MVAHEIYAARYYQARRRDKQVSQQGYVTVLFYQDKKGAKAERFSSSERQL